jgi:hypothetical protein
MAKEVKKRTGKKAKKSDKERSVDRKLVAGRYE